MHSPGCEKRSSKCSLPPREPQVFLLLPNILNEKGLFGRLALLQMDSVAALTSDLSRLLDQADKHTHAPAAEAQALALERLAQALQVAMASGALLCSRGKRGAINQILVRQRGFTKGRRKETMARSK